MSRIVLAGALAGIIAAVDLPEPPIQVSHRFVGTVITHTVAPGETLTDVGSRVGVDVATIAAMNGLRHDAKLTIGQELRIDSRHIVPPVVNRSLIINIPQRILFLFEDDTLVRAFPVALGRPTWPTPTGFFSILTKETDPTWDVPSSIQREMEREGKEPVEKVPPGPDNPLGDRWFGLSLPGVGIHGTNAPASIYHHQTHGCIRLHPDDIRALFDRVPVGATGEIIYRPVLLAVVEGHVYVESHRDVYRKLAKPLEALRASADQLHLTDAIDWRLAAAVIRENAGIARDVTAAPCGAN
jgi:L,D-transpeptidase ErfK/SrfK